MRRIGFIFFFLQMGFVSLVFSQDDSSVIQQPEIQPKLVTDSIKPKPVVKKKVTPVSIVKSDTVGIKDSVPVVKKDTILSGFAYGKAVLPYIDQHPFYNISTDVIYTPSQLYRPANKDQLFYIMCGVLFFLGILRVGFPKYFQDMFNAFWRSAFRQKQIRDQLQQAGMTTLLFNIFFVVSGGLFAYLVIEYMQGNLGQPLILFAICLISVAAIYIVKYFVLKLTGWMFGQEMVVDTYIFMVFLVNKVLSIFLIPFILLLAFADVTVKPVAFTVSLIVIFSLLVYRFILSYSGLRNELKISVLHLFLYVCGFEIIPVLLIYRLLLFLFQRSS